MDLALRLLSGSQAGRVVPLSRGTLRLGRGSAVEVDLGEAESQFVSRLHVSIVRTDSSTILVDEASTNGTYINGTRTDRAALELGDVVQFGGGGPKAEVIKLTADSRVPELARQPPPSASGTPAGNVSQQAGAGEGMTVHIRRVVQDTLSKSPQGGAGRWLLGGVTVLAVVALASSALVALGLVGEPANERRLDRWQDEYREAVVLVEVGVSVGDAYQTLGWGTGFVVDSTGLIITNKHVIHGHKYAEGTACLAEAFRRRGLPFEDALTITVWPGGSRFRQDSADESGDLQLGYSTQHGSLELVATASDAYADAVTQTCSDPFSGTRFQFRWRKHLQDNSDLALLRAADEWTAIPLADEDPPAGDPVMVLGFPSALTPLETTEAEPIARKGEVLRTQETVLIDAVVLGGNSGGPLIDSNGLVVGVATRGISGLLNMGIKTQHVRELLDHAKRTTP